MAQEKLRSSAPPTPLPGAPLGRYELLRRLGNGGMADVYLARLRCPGGFEKRFAVKMLKRSLAAKPLYIEMFLHEARVAARLQHPNIVQVLDLGCADDRYFMAMEYLSGVTLGRVFEEMERGDRQPLSPLVACASMMQACEGLHSAHEATDERGRPMSLVHLDVSPQNLLVTTSGTVKLIDFGIARSTASTRALAPSPFRGKFSYASPEQLDGEVPDRRSDVFSLGTVLWELLAGRSLFRGDTPLESFYKVSEAPIPSLRSVRADVPATLDDVVGRALSRNPDARYQTALDFFRELAGVAHELGPHPSSSDLAEAVIRGGVAAKPRAA